MIALGSALSMLFIERIEPPRLDVKPILEWRERLERRENRDFWATAPDNRSDLLTRFRPGVELGYGKTWSAVIQYQYVHGGAWTPSRNFSTEGSDLTRAQVSFKGREALATVGRQWITIGEGRLIESSSWSNAGRSYDGVRLQAKKLDLFAAKIGVASIRQPNARLLGGAISTAAGQTLLVYKYDKSVAGTADHVTLSQAWRQSLGRFVLSGEAAGQAGRYFGKSHEAWAFYSAIEWRASLKASVSIELNAASGGSGAKSRTFDNLYPGNHRLYGTMDLQSWRNMNGLALNGRFKGSSKLDLWLAAHLFSLRDPKDAWYSDNGNPNTRKGGIFRDPTGRSGRDVGREVDLDITFRLDPRSTLAGGIGLFQPGRFVRSVLGTGATRQLWGFVSASYKF